MRPLNIEKTHFQDNAAHYGDPRLHPKHILEAQQAVWRQLEVTGGIQKALPENFLLIGEPYEEGGAIYSKIFNDSLIKDYKAPTVGQLYSNDPANNVKVAGNGHVWVHSDQSEADVIDWYKKIAGEAKGGRVLFNLHYKDGWDAIFHEPVHESAPDGGIGTAPLWTYEGYCEIFAKKIATSLGFMYSYESGPYAHYVTATEKLIKFAGETHVARAYFTNNEKSCGLLSPIWYKRVVGHEIVPNISAYIPDLIDIGDVPSAIMGKLTSCKSPTGMKPDWYKRWVTLFGRGGSMPEAAMAAKARLPGLPPLPNRGGPQPVPNQPVRTLDAFDHAVWANWL